MKKFYLIISIMALMTAHAFSQEANDSRLKEVAKLSGIDSIPDGWVTGGGIGLDFSQLALINPKVGSGENRIAFGALGSLYAKYKKGRHSWDNAGSLQLAAQKLGKQDFTKSLDLLRVGSKYGYQFNSPKWYAALEATFQSLLLKTYNNSALKGNPGDTVFAKFLNPAIATIAPGIDYKPNSKLSLFLSPASIRMLIVADQSIANLNLHGTQLSDDGINYKKMDFQFGANFKGVYVDNYFNDRITFTSSLNLFSNYLRDPQNIKVLWQNNLGVNIFKNFSINFLLEAFYDHDILVQIDPNGDGVYSPDELGRRVSWTQAIYVKYNFVF